MTLGINAAQLMFRLVWLKHHLFLISLYLRRSPSK